MNGKKNDFKGDIDSVSPCICMMNSADSWRLSPAYDLTYSNTYYGEHTTTVDGNGRNPGKKELLAVGTMAGIKKELCMDIITEIKSSINGMLEMYLK